MIDIIKYAFMTSCGLRYNCPPILQCHEILQSKPRVSDVFPSEYQAGAKIE